MPSLKLEDYADHELLALFHDNSDGSGFATSADVAEQLGHAGQDLKRATQNVAIRFSWLKRYGVMARAETTREIDGRTRRVHGWRLTPVGEQLVTSSLRKAQADAIEALGEERLMALARAFGHRFATADGAVAKMMQRQMRNSEATRKRSGLTMPGTPKPKAA